MASLDDLLTALKNVNTALSTLSSTWLKGEGNLTSAAITADTLVITGSGRLVSASCIVAGSGAGTIYNAVSVAALADLNALCVVDDMVGITMIGMVFNAGLVVSPGSGQTIVVTYYSGP